MANATPNEWSYYSKTHPESGDPYYLHSISREKAKAIREQVKKIKRNK